METEEDVSNSHSVIESLRGASTIIPPSSVFFNLSLSRISTPSSYILLSLLSLQDSLNITVSLYLLPYFFSQAFKKLGIHTVSRSLFPNQKSVYCNLAEMY